MAQQFWIKQTWQWLLKLFYSYEIINFLFSKISSKLDNFFVKK